MSRSCDDIVEMLQDYLCVTWDGKPYINNIGEVKENINLIIKEKEEVKK
jgi:hypothetical protein